MESREIVLFFFQAEDGIRDYKVTGVQTCALPISRAVAPARVARALQRQRRALAQLRLLADHVDHAARVHEAVQQRGRALDHFHALGGGVHRSEEHTSELQSPCNLVCRLLLEKKIPVIQSPYRHTDPSPPVKNIRLAPPANSTTPFPVCRHSWSIQDHTLRVLNSTIHIRPTVS